MTLLVGGYLPRDGPRVHAVTPVNPFSSTCRPIAASSREPRKQGGESSFALCRAYLICPRGNVLRRRGLVSDLAIEDTSFKKFIGDIHTFLRIPVEIVAKRHRTDRDVQRTKAQKGIPFSALIVQFSRITNRGTLSSIKMEGRKSRHPPHTIVRRERRLDEARLQPRTALIESIGISSALFQVVHSRQNSCGSARCPTTTGHRCMFQLSTCSLLEPTGSRN